MNGESILKAFRDLFFFIEIKSYKRLDPHSIEVVSPNCNYIFTYYGEKSWRLETK